MSPEPAAPPGPPSYDRLLAAERDRRRRLAAAAGAALVLHALLFVASPRTSPLTALQARRFGYFGPTQLVPEIDVRREEGEQPSRDPAEAGFVAVPLPRLSGGAEAPAPNPRGPAARRPERPRLGAEAATPSELVRRTVPVVKSEDLVIEVLVKPQYPYEGRLQGLEAIVELEAFVDVDGRVKEVRVIRNTGAAMFSDAAREAVLLCRFRPYEQGGKPTPVLALFRFNFRLI